MVQVVFGNMSGENSSKAAHSFQSLFSQAELWCWKLVELLPVEVKAVV